MGIGSKWQNPDIEQLANLVVAAIEAGPVGGNLTEINSYEAEVGSWQIDEGALAVTFTTSDDFTGTINGIPRLAGVSYTFNPTAGHVLPLIYYQVTAGSVFIDLIESA